MTEKSSIVEDFLAKNIAANNGNVDHNILHENVNALQHAVGIGDSALVKSLLSRGAEVNHQTKSMAVPRISPLHIACKTGNIDMLKILLSSSVDVNREDQFGFTPLHYATVARKKEIILLLLANGASTKIQSKNGSTAIDIAKQLNFDEILDALSSKMTLESDPTYPQFKDWLSHLGASQYISKFISAGYDLPFIAKHGITESDLDCVGIPTTMLGIRRKIQQLHHLERFYQKEDDDEDEGDEDEEEDEDDEDD